MTAASLLLLIVAALALAGIASVAAGALAVWSFSRRGRPPPRHRPPVTLLRPLCGDEPMLGDALATLFEQSYPGLQIVLGVQDAADPALPIIEAVRRRHPAADVTLVIDAHVAGPNRKISNLINMLPMARHDILVFSDSDLHVPADYVERIVAALDQPGVGLVTTLCTGLPTTPGLVGRLGATAISHSFLPGALMSRALGREDCLGTTMALRRGVLTRVGGLGALVRHVADDYVLAERVRRLGLKVGLAAVVPTTAVPERVLAPLLQHELRWARTIRAVEPWLFATSALQFPLFWSAALIPLSGFATWATGLFAAAWAARALFAHAVDHLLAVPPGRARAPLLLLPLRDALSVGLVLASYLGTRVVWRGRVMRVGPSPAAAPADLPVPVPVPLKARAAAADSRRPLGR